MQQARAALEVAVGWSYLEEGTVAEADRQFERVAAPSETLIVR